MAQAVNGKHFSRGLAYRITRLSDLQPLYLHRQILFDGSSDRIRHLRRDAVREKPF
jgi:hypothetical protein